MNNQQKNFLKGAPQGNPLAQRMPTGGGAGMGQAVAQGLAPMGQASMAQGYPTDIQWGGEPQVNGGMSTQGGQPPMSLGQNDMNGNWVHDQRANQMMMDRNSGGGAGMPSSFENTGKYGGFEGNYFPEARMNMPRDMNAGMSPIQGAGGNMGMAQGNADNYFPEARMNDPRMQQLQQAQQRPPMAGPGKIKQVQNPKGLMSAPPQQNGGMQRLSPGVYRDAQGRTVRR